jgi:UDPglucose 6-dehydrogenase
MKITKICCIGADMLAAYNGSYSKKCPHIQVTVVDLNVERIAAWNDEDLDNIPIYEPGLDKIVGKQEEETYSFLRMWKSN